jgi:hypothetical protein
MEIVFYGIHRISGEDEMHVAEVLDIREEL